MEATQQTPTEHGHRPQLEAEAWKRASISRSHAYELMAAQPPAFPRPVKIGKASRFVSAEVDAWIESRIRARDARHTAHEGGAE
jgi:predicted DNA-binding transcriptional regulator AlpA